jgi:electron transport complex protein RnfC
LPNRYPSGSEKQLIQLLTNKQVPVNGIALDLGIVCLNVATVFAIQQAIFARQPLLERIVTITGDGVCEPQNRWVKIGTPIAELIDACGGYTNNAQRLIMGGAMMGIELSDDAIPVVKASNCILVSSSAALKSPQPQLPCIRCGACAEVCPAQLLPQQLYWYSRAENEKKLQEYQLAACIECGCCDVVCPSHIPLVAYFRASKSKLAFNQQQTAAAALAKQRYEARQQRLQQQQDEQVEKAKKQKLAIEAMKAKMAAKRNPPELR